MWSWRNCGDCSGRGRSLRGPKGEAWALEDRGQGLHERRALGPAGKGGKGSGDLLKEVTLMKGWG